MKRDVQATAARNFGDPKSYVTPDGRDILYRIDWKRRKEELWKRCEGRCENTIEVFGYMNQDCVSKYRCHAEAVDAHHKTLRSRKRNDALEALLAVCRRCHDLLDRAQRKERFKR